MDLASQTYSEMYLLLYLGDTGFDPRSNYRLLLLFPTSDSSHFKIGHNCAYFFLC
jgi:hypothetical protein